MIAGYKLAESQDWQEEVIMLQRHEVLSGGVKVDQDWWYTSKLIAVIVIAAAAAFAVIATFL